MNQISNSNLFYGNTEIAFYDSKKTPINNSCVKLYKIELTKYIGLVSDFLNILTPTEISRAESYYFEKDKNRFIICRALLKFILKEQTGLDLSEIYIEKGHNKKPFFSTHPQLFFNISHSGDYAVVALNNYEIGIDIEHLDNHLDINEIMPQVFSKKEIDFVLKANNQKYAFYKTWTRKEAIVKATGKGIDDNLSKIPALNGFHHIDSELLSGIQNLQVLTFDLDEQHIGSIAYENKEPNLKKITFHPIPSININ